MADPIKDIEVILMPDGLRGPAGKDAYELAVSEGFEGTLDEWLESIIGPEGKNAYDLAVEEGFEGTLEEWLGSLRGQKGDKVDPGPQGPGLADEEAQEVHDEVDTLKDMVIGIGSGEGGKAYPTLADAQAVDPKPADGTVFQVEEEENAGYWVFDSSEPGGTKFLREFGASQEDLNALDARVGQNTDDIDDIEIITSRVDFRYLIGRNFTITKEVSLPENSREVDFWLAIDNIDIHTNEDEKYVYNIGYF